MDPLTIIQTVGFPIACVIGCCLFINKMYTDYKKSQDEIYFDISKRNQEREDKLYITLGEVNQTNREISETNQKLVGQFTTDIAKVKNDVEDIKNAVLKQ